MDDDPRNRALVRGRLHSLYEVLDADSGSRAIELISSSHVDLVLLDVMMPAMNGFDTCRAIKARPGCGFLPVILFTALDGQEERNEGLAAGADEFLTKPVDHRELLLRVGALLKLKEQDARIRAQVAQLHEKENLIRRQLDELQHLQLLKDDLVALLLHDLRNPLSGIVGNLELLQYQLSHPSQPKLLQLAARAVESSKVLENLVDGVLEVQKLEEGELPLQRSPASVVGIAREALKTLEGAATSRGIALEILADGDPVLLVDRALLRRALENLVANAVKFSPANVSVCLGVRSGDARVELDVSDRGPGVSDSMKVRLFKKYASVEAKESGERRRGFGLGLHLVKLVASAHGGEVFIRDRDGGGSVFGLALPAHGGPG